MSDQNSIEDFDVVVIGGGLSGKNFVFKLNNFLHFFWYYPL